MGTSYVMFSRRGGKSIFELFVLIESVRIVAPFIDISKFSHVLDDRELRKKYSLIDTRLLEKDLFDVLSECNGDKEFYLEEIYCKKSFIAIKLKEKGVLDAIKDS